RGRGLLPDLAAVVVTLEGLVDPAGGRAARGRARRLLASRLPIEAKLVAEIDDLVAAEEGDQSEAERAHAENVSPAERERSALRTEAVLGEELAEIAAVEARDARRLRAVSA